MSKTGTYDSYIVAKGTHKSGMWHYFYYKKNKVFFFCVHN